MRVLILTLSGFEMLEFSAFADVLGWAKLEGGLDIEYDKVKNKIHDGKFRDREVREFIKYLQTDLQKVYEIFQHTQVDPDYPERTRVEEVARKTLRDYKKLITIYIEEEEKDGQD